MRTRQMTAAALIVPILLGGSAAVAGAASAAPATVAPAAAPAAQAPALLPAIARWYTVTTYTSDIKNAGTDGRVWVRLHGSRGSSRWLRLDNKRDNFERRQFDSFRFVLADLGTLRKVQIHFQRSGHNPAWHLGYVRVNGTYFPANTWFKSTGTKQFSAA